MVERFILTIKSLLSCLSLVPYHRETFQRELVAIADWYNAFRPHTWLGGKTPDEVHYDRYPANRSPRFEPRASGRAVRRVPNLGRSSRARPAWRGLEVTFHAGRKHLPVITLRRAG